MNVDEVQTVKAAVGVLETHGYTDAATTLKAVLQAEFAKTAQSLHSPSSRNTRSDDRQA